MTNYLLLWQWLYWLYFTRPSELVGGILSWGNHTAWQSETPERLSACDRTRQQYYNLAWRRNMKWSHEKTKTEEVTRQAKWTKWLKRTWEVRRIATPGDEKIINVTREDKKWLVRGGRRTMKCHLCYSWTPNVENSHEAYLVSFVECYSPALCDEWWQKRHCLCKMFPRK